MRHPAVLTGIIVTIGLLASTIIASLAVQSFGKSIERAAAMQSRQIMNIPSTFTVRTPDIGTINFRVANGGGGGEAFRIEAVPKVGE